jgi:alpha-L-fucosidase
MTGFQPAVDATVSLLGAEGALEWEKAGTGFAVRVPERLRAEAPCEYAWVFRVSAAVPSR